MALDIHIFVEKKNDQGIWELCDIPDEFLPNGRNRDLFYFLSGVGSSSEEGEPVFANRGIPSDSDLCEVLKEILDFHSHTYATVSEFILLNWPEHLKNSYFYIFVSRILPHAYWCQDWNNLRVLMAFDS